MADDDIIPNDEPETIGGKVKKGVEALAVALGFLDVIRDKHANKITYEEVMKYFIAHQNDSPAIVKGALLKEIHRDKINGDKIIITQFFLDKENKLVTGESNKPLGYKKEIPLSGVDMELLHLFKDDDLVIVE